MSWTEPYRFPVIYFISHTRGPLEEVLEQSLNPKKSEAEEAREIFEELPKKSKEFVTKEFFGTILFPSG